MVKHYTRRDVKKIKQKKTRKMKGGSNRKELQELGFQSNEIDYLINYTNKKRMDIIPTIHAFLGQGMPHSKIVEEMQEGEDTSIESLHSLDSNAMGKKKRGKKHTTKRKTKKQKGGTCYGTGVGANNYDPNFTIYNTRQLQLFPYKPN
jgi:hypothetical protein